MNSIPVLCRLIGIAIRLRPRALILDDLNQTITHGYCLQSNALINNKSEMGMMLKNRKAHVLSISFFNRIKNTLNAESIEEKNQDHRQSSTTTKC